MSYVGTQWYKCDFHLHTTASKCFADNTVTAEEWVAKALEAKLDCVAITDHNTGAMIDSIKVEAQKHGLIVFPGVEITCDTAKIHLLVIFDTSCEASDVEDFLIRCDIQRSSFGDQDAHSSKNIFDIIDIASVSSKAIVIPAHIDEFNGLDKVAHSLLQKLKVHEGVNGFQISNPILYDVQVSEDEQLKELNLKYHSANLDKSTVDNWRKAGSVFVKDKDCAILTFSDNPESPTSSKHGLDGIGSRYTWIKMDEQPSLEGLRQALIAPDFRIKNICESVSLPFIEPELWFKSLSIKSTELTKKKDILKIDFSPQMNTIIGGRGSGKSSVLRFIRGVFNKTAEINNLEDILKEHDDFYKVYNRRDCKGVLNPKTEISIDIVKHGIQYTILVMNITNSLKQDVKVYKHLGDGNTVIINDNYFLDFFKFEQYSQKQIYEISKNTSTLRNYIDSAIDDIGKVDKEIHEKESEYIKVSNEIRYVNDLVISKEKLISENKALDERLTSLERSDIKLLLKEKRVLEERKSALLTYWKSIKENKLQAITLIDSVSFPKLELEDNLKTKEISGLIRDTDFKLQGQMDIIKDAINAISSIHQNLTAKIKTLGLANDLELNNKQIEIESKKLGIDTTNVVSKFDEINNSKEDINNKILNIRRHEEKLPLLIEDLDKIKYEHLSKIKDRSQLRVDFLTGNIRDEKIQIDVKAFRDKSDFISKFRAIIQKESGFEDDIDALTDGIFKGIVENNIGDFKKKIESLSEAASTNKNGFSGKFYNMLCKLNNTQLDHITLLYPEDDITVKYKANERSAFKSLSTASAGQKTTAILTFILSFGDTPLLLDQPEDDLDNRLVYD